VVSEPLFLSAITVAELRAGLALLPAGKRRTGLQAGLETRVLPLFIVDGVWRADKDFEDHPVIEAAGWGRWPTASRSASAPAAGHHNIGFRCAR